MRTETVSFVSFDPDRDGSATALLWFSKNPYTD